MTPPFDPRVLTRVPATRWPVSALGAIGVAAGLTTIALAFTITNLVVAVVHGHPVLGTSLWLLGLFSLRALLAAANELVGTWAGMQVSTALREHLISAWPRTRRCRWPGASTWPCRPTARRRGAC